jgi:superfamily II DNA/RNA helicase
MASILNGRAFFVPSIDPKNNTPLQPWSGYGPNLLRDLDEFPPSGYLQTRVEVVLRITRQNHGRGPAGRKASWRHARDELEIYGLDVAPFDDTDFYDTLGNFLSSPCFIHILGSGSPEMPKMSPLVSPIPAPKPNLSKVDTSWIKNKLGDMYPGQTLYSEQKDAIEHAIGIPGSLTTAILPTGLGKTRIAQALAISLTRGHGDQKSSEGPVLIIYPTISLMDDQKREWEEDLREDMLKAGLDPLRVRVIHSGMGEEDVDEIDALLIRGELDAVLCSPERLVPKTNNIGLIGVAARLGGGCKGRPFSALIIDEAHIIYDWGESIREAFHLIPQVDSTLREINPNLRTLLMTATLTPREEEDLVDRLGGGLRPMKSVRLPKIRPDLAFTVIHEGYSDVPPLAEKVWNEFINHHKWRKQPPRSNSPLLIYTSRVQACTDIAKKLRPRVPKRWETYHGGTTPPARARALNRFQRDEIDLMVATSAFGMGVNKDDVWLIGYVGKPPTVRELYQSFGRAARGSKWSSRGATTRLNGNCIALISNQHRSLPWRPVFKPPKQMERFWPMITGGGATSNGYVLLSLTSSTRQIFWDPYDESDHREGLVKEEDRERMRLSSLTGYNMSNIGADLDTWWAGRYEALLAKREREERPRRRMAAIYAELGGYLRILGAYPGNPVLSEKFGTLREMLEQGGHARVLESYSEIAFPYGFNSDDSSLYLVAEVIKEIDGFDGYLSAFQEGQDIARDWTQKNLDELSEFLKSDDCIRKRFAPVVGGDSATEESCFDHIQKNRKNPLPLGVPPVVPCSVCRQKLWPDNDPLHATDSNLRFDGSPPFTTWLDFDALEYLAGRAVSPRPSPKQALNGAANELPYDELVCGFAWGEANLHSDEIKQKWLDLWSGHGNVIQFDEIFDIDGNLINDDFSIKLTHNKQAIVRVELASVPGVNYPLGGLIYRNDEGLICRLISKQDSIPAFDSIRVVAPSKSAYDELSEIFMGKYKPDISNSNKKELWGM